MKKSVLTKIFVAALAVLLCFGILAACVDTGNYDISNVSVTRGSVSWTPIPEAESYKIEIGKNTYTSNSSKLDVTGIEPGTYAITITPIVNGESKKSTSKTVSIPPSATNPLHIQTPVTTFDPDKLQLSWEETANAEAYVLNVYKTDGAESEYGEGNLVFTNTGKERTATLPSTYGAGHYAATITATSAKEHHVSSAPAETRYEITKLAPVLNQKIVLKDGRLEWNSVDNASYYELTIFFGGVEQTDDNGDRYTTTQANFAFSDHFDYYGTYSVKITAHNRSASVLSSDESESFASISYNKLDTPSAVTVEKSVENGAEKATLKWDRIAQDDGNVEYVAVITADDVNLEFATTDNLLTLDDRLTLSRKYSIEIFAVDKLKRYTASDRSVKVEYSTAAVLASPTLAFDKTALKLSWNAVDNAQGYELSDGAKVVYTGNSLEYAVPSTLAAGLHEFKVKALGNNHEYLDSDYSAVKTITKLAMPQITGIAENIVNWSESVGADSYEIVLTDTEGNQIKKPLLTHRGYDIADIKAGEYTISVKAFSSNPDTIDSDKGAYEGKVKKLASDEGLGISVKNGRLIIPVAGDALYYNVSIPELGTEFPAVRAVGENGAVTVDLEERFFSDDYLPRAESYLTVRISAEGDGTTLISSAQSEAGKIYRLRSVTELKMSAGYVLKWTDGTNAASNAEYRVYYGENLKNTVTDKQFGVGTEAGSIGVDGVELSVSAYVENGAYSKTFRLESYRDARVSVSRLATPYLVTGEREFRWNPVEGASGYSVSMLMPDGSASTPVTINSTFYSPDAGFSAEGEYTVSVVPLGNNIDILDGGAGTIKHNVTKLAADAGAQVRDGKLYFEYTDAFDYEETYTVVLNGVAEAANVKFSPYTFTGKFEQNNKVLFSVNGDGFRYLSSEPVVIDFEIIRTVLDTPVVERVLNEGGKASLVWQPVTMASGYELVFTNGVSEVIVGLDSNVTSYDLRRFYERESNAEGVWSFTLKAVGKGEFILHSAPTASVLAEFLAAPTDVRTEKNLLKWTSAANRFIVRITQNGITSEFLVETTSSAENVFDLRSELSAGAYSVTVATAAPENSIDVVDSAQTAALTGEKLPSVTGVTAKNNGLSWNPVAGATKYNFKVENSAGDIISESELVITDDKVPPSVNFPFVSSGRVFVYVTALNATANNIESDDSAKLEFGKLPSPSADSIYVFDNVLHWEKVAGAKSYKVSVTNSKGNTTNNTVPASTNEFKLALDADDYTISIVAVGDGGALFDSAATNEFSYAAQLSVPKNVRYDNKVLYWDKPEKADYADILYDLEINGTPKIGVTGNRLLVIGGEIAVGYNWNENGTNVVKITAKGNTGSDKKYLKDSDTVTTLVECAIYPVLSFETFGGTAMEERTFKYDTVPSRPADPQKTNYKFAGWYADNNYSTPYNFDTAITADITIYAKWLKIVDYVTFGGQFDRTTYEKGDTVFDPAGGKLLVYYKDGSSEMVSVTVDMVSDFGQYTQQIGPVNVTLLYVYDGVTYTVTVEFTVVETASKIELTTPFNKTSYFIGDNFDPTGGLITVTYADATTEAVAVTADMVEFDSSAAGESVTVTINYTHYGAVYSCSTAVKVEKKVERIELTTDFTKKLYIVGDAFDATGGRVTVYYNDNSTEVVNVTADMVTGFDSSAPNPALTLTITYMQYETPYTATVSVAVERRVTQILLTTDFTKKVYLQRDTFDPTGGKITISYEGVYERTIDVTADMVSGFDSSQANESLVITITYYQGSQAYTTTTTLKIEQLIY